VGDRHQQGSRSLVDLALGYAANAVAVFPCTPGGKTPLTPHGFHDATVDAEQINRWWATHPQANIATPTGRAPVTGGIAGSDVLDVDVRADGHGWDAFHTLRRAGLLDGWTRVVRTPSGGLHLHYPGTTQRNGSLRGQHVDFRALGGYVLLPGSRCGTNRQPYTLVDQRPGPGRPLDWTAVTSLLQPHQPQVLDRPLVRGAGDRTSWLAAHVAHQTEGNRNNALFWAACRAAEAGATDLTPLLDAAVFAGLDLHQAVATIRSAQRTTGRPSPARPIEAGTRPDQGRTQGRAGPPAFTRPGSHDCARHR
jgi:hypothetical protein